MNLKNIVIAGGGVLGSQIAFQTAYKGYNVKVWLRSEGSIERAKPKLERLKNIYIDTLTAMKTDPSAYARGLADSNDLSEEEIDKLIEKAKTANENILLTTSYEEAFKEADFVIEAIAEIPEEKIDFYSKMKDYLPEHTIVATNSSTLLPSQFAEYTGRPEKYLALHFANTIWINNTAEVMGHPGTSQEYYNQIVEFAESIGMIPLQLKKEQAGYILNSMLVPLLDAAEALVANGVADYKTVDLTWKTATGAPKGPFQILDVIGLTTAYNVVSMKPDSNNPETTPGKIAAMLKKYIDEGKTGINAGEGFYKYK
ncbi:MAG: 3-hydroxyacyl-CoA dehydrogenase [Peptoniphilaceae bacterium]